MKLLENVSMPHQYPDVSIHLSAIVDPGAQIGARVNIWHFSHICGGAKIGSDVTIGQNVFIGNKVLIGNNCKIQNNVSIYDGVNLEDGVFCGPSMVFTNVYNPRSLVDRKSEYRNTIVKKGVTLGANCTIVCGVTIDKFAFIGAGAVIKENVKSYAIMVGVPARQIGWMSEFGERIPLPLCGEGLYQCPHTLQIYRLVGDQIYREEKC